MKSLSNPFVPVSVAAVALALATSAHATTITLSNADLESPSIAPWTWYNPALTGWTSEYGTYGVAPVSYGGGSQCAWSCWNNGWFSLSQNSAYTVGAAGETITAGVYVRTSNLDSGQITVNLQLRLDGVQVAFTQPAYYSNVVDWTLLTTEYTTTASDIGKTVGIAFGSDGGWTATGGSYVYLDNPNLDVVPEPQTALLGAFGLLSLLSQRRNPCRHSAQPAVTKAPRRPGTETCP